MTRSADRVAAVRHRDPIYVIDVNYRVEPVGSPGDSGCAMLSRRTMLNPET